MGQGPAVRPRKRRVGRCGKPAGEDLQVRAETERAGRKAVRRNEETGRWSRALPKSRGMGGRETAREQRAGIRNTSFGSCSPLICGDSGQPYPVGRRRRALTLRGVPSRRSPVTRHVPCYSRGIEIAHKGLLAFFERGDARRIPASLAPRIRRILSDLDAAVQPGDMKLPGYRLHPLTGDRRGQWSVRVSGNWRIVFRFEDGAAVDVTLIDYH